MLLKQSYCTKLSTWLALTAGTVGSLRRPPGFSHESLWECRPILLAGGQAGSRSWDLPSRDCQIPSWDLPSRDCQIPSWDFPSRDCQIPSWDLLSRDCWRPSAHRSRGTEPVQPGAGDAGRGRQKGVPRSCPLFRGAFPAGRASFVSRWLLLRLRPAPPLCRWPGSLLAAPGSRLLVRCSRLPSRCSRLPAMLGRCAPGSPGPRPVVRALPPSASALRQRLRQCAERIPEAEAVLDLLEKCPEHQKKGGFPVIVFEGLDATGKTTVTQAVKDTLNGVLLRSPPACISQWRTVFDDEPTPVKRAFYAAGNYILASEIAKASTQAPVIIDRYWHSTAAYAIATETSGKVQDLPPAQDEVYQWPDDLLKPDLVLLLTVDPEERVRRLQHRGLEKTKEEAELEANSLFRQRVEESYRRMVNPACQEVDASPSKEEVLKTVLQLIKKHCAF
ncbi:UMP-CMP kinase 2, mitochondrial [Onychostruthus taczanowskii]|uniref:UMP-CMP kinase 2, mitochondrial n=1 Tax=Onychostruthus taczanowskii TaxID=356909 RepID=UPI001B805762|nr:UMP-CMP kinase 2, mitochondrial [Onychostruthus taczanowskii]